MDGYKIYKRMCGKGKGSVLLKPLGSGGASTYDLEEYLGMTGKGYYNEPNHMKGNGYDSNSNIIETALGRKMSQLKVKSIERKPKRIQLK